ncbi:hypothetical protein [Haloferula sp. BvORR071]|uniref:hypothetical protein n=1 Tax=Haloferula sp. BvORR071 TaxID=1396141 RepID=UPI0005536D5F|nr:hypothetical protein [Haloferula sp. BvORR071]
MLHRLNFITGIVMLIVAGTLVFVVTKGDDASPAATTDSRDPEMATLDPGARYKVSRAEPRTPQPKAASGRREAFRAATKADPRMPKPGQLRSDLRIQIDPPNSQHEDLEQRAQRVEAFALRRLGALTAQLDLTAEQQARIFPILARGSQSYDPRMQIVTGSQARPITTGEDAVASVPIDKSQEQALVDKELNSTQSAELVNQSIQDLLVWEEIIDGLSNQLDQATPGQVDEASGGTSTEVPAVEAPAAATPVPAADPVAAPESHGGRNLFDQSTPAN